MLGALFIWYYKRRREINQYNACCSRALQLLLQQSSQGSTREDLTQYRMRIELFLTLPVFEDGEDG